MLGREYLSIFPSLHHVLAKVYLVTLWGLLVPPPLPPADRGCRSVCASLCHKSHIGSQLLFRTLARYRFKAGMRCTYPAPVTRGRAWRKISGLYPPADVTIYLATSPGVGRKVRYKYLGYLPSLPLDRPPTHSSRGHFPILARLPRRLPSPFSPHSILARPRHTSKLGHSLVGSINWDTPEWRRPSIHPTILDAASPEAQVARATSHRVSEILTIAARAAVTTGRGSPRSGRRTGSPGIVHLLYCSAYLLKHFHPACISLAEVSRTGDFRRNPPLACSTLDLARREPYLHYIFRSGRTRCLPAMLPSKSLSQYHHRRHAPAPHHYYTPCLSAFLALASAARLVATYATRSPTSLLHAA